MELDLLMALWVHIPLIASFVIIDAHRPTQAKVNQLDLEICSDHNVLHLDIIMEDTTFMHHMYRSD